MIVEFDKSFVKWLTKIKDNVALQRIENEILKIYQNLKGVEKNNRIQKIFSFTYWRISNRNRKKSENKIILIIGAHRSEIYKIFP